MLDQPDRQRGTGRIQDHDCSAGNTKRQLGQEPGFYQSPLENPSKIVGFNRLSDPQDTEAGGGNNQDREGVMGQAEILRGQDRE